MANDRYVLGPADALADGERRLVEIDGRSIVVFRRQERYYALLNRCPHRGAPLHAGRLIANITSDQVGEYVYHGENRMLACPWHGWEFDLATGQSYFDPKGVRARPFQVEVEPGQQVQQDVLDGRAVFTPAEFACAADVAQDADGLQPGPYRAETFEVAVEDDYLVLSMRPPRPPRPRRADAEEKERVDSTHRSE